MTINSQQSAMSLAVQTDKDTAAQFNFVTGLLTQSQLATPAWDVIEPGEEHPSPLGLATDRNSLDERFGFLTPYSSTGMLYPRFFGMLLRGAGFGVSSTDNTTYYSHDFTLVPSDDVVYLTALWSVGQGTAGEFTRRSAGVRMNSVGLTATPREITVSAAGNGLTDQTAGGSEVLTAEQKTKLLPTLGSVSVDIGGTELTTDVFREASINIEQTLDTEDYALWTQGRVDMPQTLIGINGSFSGVDASFNEYKKLNWGGTSGTEADYNPVTADLDWTWQSVSNISGAAVPYSVRVQMPNCQLMMTGLEASGSDLVRFGFDYSMVNLAGTPITITIVNDHASYEYAAA